MGVVLLYLSVSLLLSAPFGVAAWRHWSDRMPDRPGVPPLSESGPR